MTPPPPVTTCVNVLQPQPMRCPIPLLSHTASPVRVRLAIPHQISCGRDRVTTPSSSPNTNFADILLSAARLQPCCCFSQQCQAGKVEMACAAETTSVV